MALVQSIDDAKVNQYTRQKNDSNGVTGTSTTVPFFGSRDTPDLPHASLTTWAPGRISRPHFHENNQFQVIVGGKGQLGRHAIAPYSVHFSRAYTPYGPLLTDPSSSLSFFVMRPRFDPGSQRLPRELEKLKAIPNRQPWQTSCHVNFPTLEPGANTPSVMLRALSEIHDDHGLAIYTLNIKPNAESNAPDPSQSGGQYVVVVKGSFLHQEKEHTALALVFVYPSEKPFKIRAGAQGLEALVLSFPRPQA